MAKIPVQHRLDNEFILDNKVVIKIIDDILTELRIYQIQLKDVKALLKDKNTVNIGYDKIINFINEHNLKDNGLDNIGNK